MLGMQRLMLAASVGLGVHSAVGGWAVITVENPPDYLEAGASYRLEYTVRQHGQNPLTGLKGSVLIQPAGSVNASRVSVQATPGSRQGGYTATVRVPDADQVTLTVNSGFSGGGWGDLTLMAIPIVRPGQARPSITQVERGQRLFVAKGCGSCHVNGDVPEFARMNRVLEGVAPELTGRRLEAAYVRQRLTNPSSLPKLGDGPVRMPQLGLAAGEVEALVALISGTGEKAGQ
jgi:hypothetical protein